MKRTLLTLGFSLMLLSGAVAQDNRPAYEYLALKPDSGKHLVYLRMSNNLSFYTDKGDQSWGVRAAVYQLPASGLPTACKLSKQLIPAFQPEKPACAPDKMPKAKLSYSSQNKPFMVKDFNSSLFHTPVVLNRQGEWLSVAYREAAYASSYLVDLLMVYHLPSQRAAFIDPNAQALIQVQLRKKFPAYFRDENTAALMPKPVGFSNGALIFSLHLNANCMDSDLPDCMDVLAAAGEKFAGYWSYQPANKQVSLLSWDRQSKQTVEPTGSLVRFAG